MTTIKKILGDRILIQRLPARTNGAIIAPDDRELGNAPEQLPVPETAKCAQCGSTFKPARAGQKYCPEPDDWNIVSCGRKALLDELHKRRPPEAQRKNAASKFTEKSIR